MAGDNRRKEREETRPSQGIQESKFSQLSRSISWEWTTRQVPRGGEGKNTVVDLGGKMIDKGYGRYNPP